MLAFENFLETADRLLTRHIHTRNVLEGFRHVHGLGKEFLNPAGTGHSLLVFGREFINPKDGNDVLKVLDRKSVV